MDEHAQDARKCQRDAIQAAFARSKVSAEDLWSSYVRLGGVAGPDELEAFLDGGADLDPAQRDLVAVAAAVRGAGLAGAAPGVGPLAALVELMRGGYAAPA
jgi:hypothetical protein